jgi:hypothetical protein
MPIAFLTPDTSKQAAWSINMSSAIETRFGKANELDGNHGQEKGRSLGTVPSKLDCSRIELAFRPIAQAHFLPGNNAIGLAMSSGQITMRASLTHQVRWDKCAR